MSEVARVLPCLPTSQYRRGKVVAMFRRQEDLMCSFFRDEFEESLAHRKLKISNLDGKWGGIFAAPFRISLVIDSGGGGVYSIWEICPGCFMISRPT